jgi:hypothetical protein
MRRVALAIIAATTVLTAPVGVLAAGGPIRKPPVTVSGLTIPAISTAPSAPALAPGMTQGQVFGGCGGRRIADARSAAATPMEGLLHSHRKADNQSEVVNFELLSDQQMLAHHIVIQGYVRKAGAVEQSNGCGVLLGDHDKPFPNMGPANYFGPTTASLVCL